VLECRPRAMLETTLMLLSRKLALSLSVLAAASLAGSLAVAEVLKRAPPMGALKPGQVVLVDDGSCPAGQIRQLTGGDHVKAGGKQHAERRSRCVAR
jgi:hypothetical protein